MKLKIDESKTLEFEMDASGISWKDLQGYFRLTLEGVEYGFPVNINEGVVTVDIPVIKDVLHESVRSSLYEHREVTVKARLDLIANNEIYINPWSGDIDIDIPVSVKIIEEKEVKKEEKKTVKVIDPDVKAYIDEEKKDKKAKKSKLMESFGKPLEPKKEEQVEEKQVVEEKLPKKSKFSKILD